MGKRKHIKAGAGDMIKAPAGLADQIESNSFAQERAKPRGILKKTKQDGEFVPDVLSAKILRQATKQLAKEEGTAVEVVAPKTLIAKDVLITKPDKYTAASMLHATRLFAAVASPKTCEKFYRYYLLPRILDDIMEFRKLNVHLFTAVKKAMYKPMAFVKGLLLPMCESESVSMNAAHVMKAVIQSSSLPVFHAATAMIKLSLIRPLSSPVSHILSGFVQKRYTLPSLAVQHLVDFCCAYDNRDEPMPLSIHDVVRTFVQLYKLDLDEEQKQRICKTLQTFGNKTASKDTIKELRAVMKEAPSEADEEEDEDMETE